MRTATDTMNINVGSSQLTGRSGLKIEFSKTIPPQRVTRRVYLLMFLITSGDIGGVGRVLRIRGKKPLIFRVSSIVHRYWYFTQISVVHCRVGQEERIRCEATVSDQNSITDKNAVGNQNSIGDENPIGQK